MSEIPQDSLLSTEKAILSSEFDFLRDKEKFISALQEYFSLYCQLGYADWFKDSLVVHDFSAVVNCLSNAEVITLDQSKELRQSAEELDTRDLDGIVAFINRIEEMLPKGISKDYIVSQISNISHDISEWNFIEFYCQDFDRDFSIIEESDYWNYITTIEDYNSEWMVSMDMKVELVDSGSWGIAFSVPFSEILTPEFFQEQQMKLAEVLWYIKSDLNEELVNLVRSISWADVVKSVERNTPQK